MGPTLEEFAGEHELPPRWLEVRRACTQLVERADFWHRADLRDAARRFAVEASDLFHSGLKTDTSFFHDQDISEKPKSDRGDVSVDEAYMNRAIALAKIALTHGDTPVGALVVREGKIIAEGIEAVRQRIDVSAHAELIAIQNACSALRSLDLSGCVLYTTAEPCFMCSYAVRQTRIGKVVLGRATPGVGGISSNHPILTDPLIPGWEEPPEIISAVLESE